LLYDTDKKEAGTAAAKPVSDSAAGVTAGSEQKSIGDMNCPECKERFKSLVLLRKHIRDKHGQ